VVTPTHGRRASRWALACALVVVSALLSCEKIVGIHDVGTGGAGGTGGQGHGGEVGGAGASSFGGRDAGGEGPSMAGEAGAVAGAGGGGSTKDDGGHTDHPDTDAGASLGGGSGDASSGRGGGLAGMGGGGAAGGAAGTVGGAGGEPVAPMCPSSSSRSGTAYRFTAGPRASSEAKGLCSYPNAELPLSRYYGAIDQRLWSSANACGRCLEVSSLDDPAAKVEVEIIDIIKSAPDFGDDSLALDDEARFILTNGKDVNPAVTFKFVPCADPGTIKVSFPSAVPQAPQVLVMGYRWALTSVEIKSGANWVALTRPEYNVWMLPNGSSVPLGSPVSLRLTDELGESLVVDKVPLTQNVTDLHVQFAMCR